ncbi:MAG: helix-turn-helix domain-containing protein [Candidatus Alectryocaccobium sp.]|jgi:two-component system response regulator YesN|nr:AraC family transcriptional regulator [Lachnospiraceae bacterium]MDY6221821.1 AraC family transcriptional regulator [Candidatus Alectryocaccobium sp.]
MRSGVKAELAHKARSLIEQSYADKFSLQNIADELYVNRSYISRVFTEVNGYTLVRYHNYIRCIRSLEMLDDPRMKIEDVSEKVGYSSLSHFIKEFKRQFGVTPSEYRKRGIKRGKILDRPA